LLYELLTGTTPLDRKRLKEAAFAELLRVIREEEPQRPSTRLSSTEELPSIAANRGMEPRTLSGLLRGELDWIVMRALEKDRGRRYETANSLALDLLRYLAHEPVQACPPSAAYRLRKFAQRNKGLVLAAALVLLVLVAGIIGTSWQAVRASDARQTATDRLGAVERANVEVQTALDETKSAKALTEAALKDSEAAGKQAEAVAGLMDALFRGVSPKDQRREFTRLMLERIDQLTATLEKDYAADPLVRAKLRHALGIMASGFGEPE